ncbi:S-formylglutathione hydrolase [Vitiosangium sp. GDMCC 1.1324]|uniref:S-formylglutathione hydrolase n=1 Tax=Vitiosangium sp. (strain GDMCC 1.1324) TaxID=2138576 RepID=UPI000D360FB9|nr:S-formylglutathione hydrolase [Vitiosangium sp. GDMCC 1.1324]PTL81742.1 S-formylglutathione hydrolase [Vitiosangium sp. GDMCC 1.1324]
MEPNLRLASEHRCFDGTVAFYRHDSEVCGGEMRFAVYLPPQARAGKVPVLYYLSGLTCTEETFLIKAGAQRLAAELGLMLVVPDTSPRSTGIPKEDADWEVGTAAGFYVDATQPPWASRFRMFSYVTRELPELVGKNFPARMDREGIFGHSMGGHGALVCALRQPGRYRSVSAFAPISAPMRCPWGQKAFTTYFGPDREAWRAWDTTELISSGARLPPLLVDQGTRDKFLVEQLKPELLQEACKHSGQPLTLRVQDGYDHGYYFVSTFIADHLRHHAAALNA